jgi:hypothetical protein
MVVGVRVRARNEYVVLHEVVVEARDHKCGLVLRR